MSKYIECEALLEDLNCCGCVTVYGEQFIDAVTHRINLHPAADVAPVVHTHWAHWPRKVFDQDGSYTLVMDTSCSKCNWHIPEGMDSPFCPRCGARMDEMISTGNG